MTLLLEKVLTEVYKLPPEKQDTIAEKNKKRLTLLAKFGILVSTSS